MLRHPGFFLSVALAKSFLFFQEIGRVCSEASDQNKMRTIKQPHQISLKLGFQAVIGVPPGVRAGRCRGVRKIISYGEITSEI